MPLKLSYKWNVDNSILFAEIEGMGIRKYPVAIIPPELEVNEIIAEKLIDEWVQIGIKLPMGMDYVRRTIKTGEA